MTPAKCRRGYWENLVRVGMDVEPERGGGDIGFCFKNKHLVVGQYTLCVVVQCFRANFFYFFIDLYYTWFNSVFRYSERPALNPRSL